jgi:hypothetical protein
VLYKSFGIYFCPVCFCKQEFISYDPDLTDPCLAECIDCGHQFGHFYNEMTGEHGPVLTAEMVAKGQAERRRQLREDVLRAGGRLESLNGVARPPRRTR